MKLTTTVPMSSEAFLHASFLSGLLTSASSGGSLSYSRYMAVDLSRGKRSLVRVFALLIIVVERFEAANQSVS